MLQTIPTVTAVVSSVVDDDGSVTRVDVVPSLALVVTTVATGSDRDDQQQPDDDEHSGASLRLCRSTLSAEPARNHAMCSSDIVCVVLISSVAPSAWWMHAP